MACRAIRAGLEVQQQPRPALDNIGNRLASLRKRLAAKPVDVPGRRRRAAKKEQKAPPPSPEPQQLEPHYATSVENRGWDLTEDALCQDLSKMLPDMKGKHEDDDDPDFSTCYKNLRNLKEIKINDS